MSPMHVICIFFYFTVLTYFSIYLFFRKVALAATAIIGVVDSSGDGYLLKSARARLRDFPQSPADGKSNEAFDEKL